MRTTSGRTNTSFTWSSLQVNYNTVAHWHSDDKNVGRSIIFSVGSYSGGAFVLEGFQDIDIRNKLMLFDSSAASESDAQISPRIHFSMEKENPGSFHPHAHAHRWLHAQIARKPPKRSKTKHLQRGLKFVGESLAS